MLRGLPPAALVTPQTSSPDHTEPGALTCFALFSAFKNRRLKAGPGVAGLQTPAVWGALFRGETNVLVVRSGTGARRAFAGLTAAPPVCDAEELEQGGCTSQASAPPTTRTRRTDPPGRVSEGHGGRRNRCAASSGLLRGVCLPPPHVHGARPLH